MRRKQIHDESGPNLIGGLFYLLFLIGLSAAVFLGTKKSPDDGFFAVLTYAMVFGFPAAVLAGLVFLFWHRRKFGKAVLILDSFPVNLGESTTGSIEISRRLFDFSAFRLRLQCEKVYPASARIGERTKVLWRNEWLLDVDEIAFTDRSTTVPLKFSLPPDVKASRQKWIGDHIRWRLKVETLPSNRPHFASDFILSVVAPLRGVGAP